MTFSIILPVRNGGDHVKDCVNSILGQTVRDFNLIVLDNYSSDGTTEWLQSLQDPRIQLHPSDKPLGIVENWARIASVPKNEFITLIGHDDVLDSHYLETMHQLIEQHPNASLYQAHFRFIDGHGQYKRNCLPMDEVQKGHEFLACQLLATMDSTGTGYVMRSKDYDLLGGIPDYPNLIFADYELWTRLSLISYKATALRECFSYREHTSTSFETNGELYQLAFLRYMSFLQEITERHAPVREVVSRYGRHYIYRYCEAMAHRLLKTKRSKRKTSVAAFIGQCRQMAARLIPGQEFEPMNVFRIRLAVRLDSSALGRTAFRIAKKVLKTINKA